MAFRTIGGILSAERLGTVVAGTAELTRVDIIHCNAISALLHLEQARLMAIRTLEAFICVNLAVKYDLAGSFTLKLYGLARRYGEGGTGKNKRNDYY